eukprot:CAMPEP_0174275822 /NCGR_PEP_ID=MMETSP0439-20130205/60046_1 /TAXON_ID=0 /ORGANISM="Stereomyxa ramosa, Strain Chinc5" /LENGTH=308 /DNA_ID=CAMNT_0015367985 /DNA_START=677 /DNA_END=1603 /DNA_ORIENTATION=-
MEGDNSAPHPLSFVSTSPPLEFMMDNETQLFGMFDCYGEELPTLMCTPNEQRPMNSHSWDGPVRTNNHNSHINNHNQNIDNHNICYDSNDNHNNTMMVGSNNIYCDDNYIIDNETDNCCNQFDNQSTNNQQCTLFINSYNESNNEQNNPVQSNNGNLVENSHNEPVQNNHNNLVETSNHTNDHHTCCNCHHDDHTSHSNNANPVVQKNWQFISDYSNIHDNNNSTNDNYNNSDYGVFLKQLAAELPQPEKVKLGKDKKKRKTNSNRKTLSRQLHAFTPPSSSSRGSLPVGCGLRFCKKRPAELDFFDI